MRFIWATRGYAWGFRFLRDGELPDPLPEYSKAFSGIQHVPEGWNRNGETVALRFLDPLGRQDSAGRVIPHEFVLFGSPADGVDSVEDGRRILWPLVEADFARLWKRPDPLSASE